MSDYLWDKSGEDPEVERLELALAPLAYRGAPPRLPRRWPILISAGIAAAVAALVLLALWPRPPVPTGWETEGHALAAGEWLEPDPGTRLLSSDLGRVQLRPGTRLRVVDHGRLELDHGDLEAKISAAPRRFSVATRGALLVDLGCAFDLSVDAAGAGRLQVTEGRVALSHQGREVVVPAGAECAFTADGSGVPSPIPPPKVEPLFIPTLAPIPPPPIESQRPHAAVQKNEPRKTPPQKTQKAPAAAQKNAATQKNAAAQKNEPTKAPAKNEPAKKNDPGLKLQHDSLKDLDRSL